MIATLRGKVLKKSPEEVIIEVSGVGYEVKVPIGTLSELPDEERDVLLFIHTAVRDDAIELYGFLTEQERDFFRRLITVTGVGPRLALNILSGSSVPDLLYAIENEDLSLLTRLPGIGKKTAQRILFEMREKLPARIQETDSLCVDATSALVNLGYKKTHAQEAVKVAYDKGLKDIESILKEALKYLNS